ncbi:MAG: lytic transglycosylase domain-containing protein [Cyanobacteriota bacterium]|nr:lytic transglycosylase domain-containing protein [Cyanobacteriota bacterium]
MPGSGSGTDPGQREGASSLAAPVRRYPEVPPAPEAIAARLVELEQTLRDPAGTEQTLPALAHQQQVIYRQLARSSALSGAVLRQLPARWQPVVQRHLRARRAFEAMHRGPARTRLPAWRIIPPRPAQELLRHYREAAAITGIPWEVLAAVNLVESALGRIDGVSVANAQGPMQFLPSTWAEPGIGRGGDIREPRDAIHAAARYLVRRGGLQDIRRGLWGYNNSEHYGRGVLEYAALIREDPSAFRALYLWEVHVPSIAGDIWLPVGYDQRQPISVQTYLSEHPESAPSVLPATGR